MDLFALLVLIAIAGTCAAIAEYIVGFSPPGGILTTIVVGVVGAYIGWLVSESLYSAFRIQLLVIQVGTVVIDVFWSTLGSVILLVILFVLRDARRRVIVRRQA